MVGLEINKIHCIDWVEGLEQLPDNSIDMVITSPPYWLMRNYHLEPIIFDGHSGCDHEWGPDLKIKNRSSVTKSSKVSSHKKERQGRELNQGNYCQVCGAWRGQLGLEPTPELYIQHLMRGFIEAMRVLKPTGTCWVVLGDTRWNAKGTCFNPGEGNKSWEKWHNKKIYPLSRGNKSDCPGLNPKTLVAIPERFVLSMMDLGWTYRNRNCWIKTNPKPDSAKDRFADSWEFVYFFTKSEKYYFDLSSEVKPNRKSREDIFKIATYHPRDIKHYATFPEKLIEIFIKVGCPENGIVLDPFMGSGTVAVVARKFFRRYIGFELNPEYIKIANKRLAQMTLPLT